MTKLSMTAAGIAAVLAAPLPALAQQTIPVLDLPAPAARAAVDFGAILGVRQLPHGMVLVDDAGRRRLTLLDSTLGGAMLVLDSVVGTSRSYGTSPTPLIRYLGDSTLFPDFSSRTVLLLDARGQVARTLALPSPSDVGLMRRGAGVDAAGRVIYLGDATRTSTTPGKAPTLRDSLALLRADLERRRTDSIGYVVRPIGRVTALAPADKAMIMIRRLDPLRQIDDWAVLSDGTVAIVRGHDYHVDWIRPDGTPASSPKLPFDWKRLTDGDKQRVADSARTRIAADFESEAIMEQAEELSVVRGNALAGIAPVKTGAAEGADTVGRVKSGRFAGFTILDSSVPPDRIPDYYPPIRPGSVLADLDDNLWILPTTSSQSKQGELVYDVVNAKGELFQRVRVPLGRLIVGFGRGGVVYMQSGSKAAGFHLERSTLSTRASAK